MRRICRFLYVLLVLGCALLLGLVGYLDYALPDKMTVTAGETYHIGSWVEEQPDSARAAAVAARLTGGSYRTTLQLGGVIPLKDVTVSVVDRPVVMVCGTPFGIKMYTEGVLVVGLSDVETAAGAANPAAAAGVRIGDTIVAIDGELVSTNEEVSHLISAKAGRPVTLILRRDGVNFEATFTPVKSVEEGDYRAGLWVRDSTAGVGTLTFYCPETGAFAGLGHPVCDEDTGTVMAISGGEIVPARIYGVKPSQSGTPGELQGGFEPGKLGTLQRNGSNGLFGQLSVYPMTAQSLPVAMRQEVKTGTAQILTTVEGSKPQLYDVVVEQVRYRDSSTRHLVVRVTDPALLAKTGGIVQGMSGSPLLQNGKLIGAVTHVLVDDPTRGYGIFAENMLETARSVTELKVAG